MDSAYLLYAGVQAGADIRPYYIKTAFQPRFERDDALRLAGELGVEVTVLELDALADLRVAANPAERCYYCKQNLFRALKARAAADGYAVLLDGTNASDEAGDRPGMRALRELEVRSPLRECGLTKRTYAACPGRRACSPGISRPLRLPGHPGEALPTGRAEALTEEVLARGGGGRRTPCSAWAAIPTSEWCDQGVSQVDARLQLKMERAGLCQGSWGGGRVWEDPGADRPAAMRAGQHHPHCRRFCWI